MTVTIIQPHGQGIKKCIEVFILKGKSRLYVCVEIPFQGGALCVANEQAKVFDKKKKKDDESRNIKRPRRQKEKRVPDEVRVLIVQGSFQYFNHPRWEGRGDGRCYITHSPLLLVSLIVLLGHFFARLDIREHFSSEALLGTGLLHVYMLSPKEKKKNMW